MSVPATIRLFTCAVMLALLPVYGAQSGNGTACGQSTHSDLTGTVTSLNYPNNYQNYQTCNYYIDAPSLSTINFTFNALALEGSSTCVYDWIEFTCQSNPISQPIRFCGSGYREELSFKPCSRVLVSFASDGSVTNIGFSVSYDIEPIRCQGDCSPVSNGVNYYCPCDTNQTPFIPTPYDQCPYGCYSNSRYCACSYPPTIVDSNSSTSPPHTSAGLLTTPHFIPTNSPDCGQSTYSDLTGSITSLNYPNYYQNNQNCNYYIEAPSLSTITFTFNGLGLEQTPLITCYYDWIEFTCESNSFSRPIRYCGFGYRPQLSFTPCSRVRLSFVSDVSVTNIGFSVSYEIQPIRCQGDCSPVFNGASYSCPCDANKNPFIPRPYDQCPYYCYSSTPCACSYPPAYSSTPPSSTTDSPLACGQGTYSSLSGNITSLNYPNNYPNYQTCNYYIDAPSLSTINFTFNGLGLERITDCIYDWIEITCESNSISQPIRYCGFGYRPQLSFKPCSRVRLSFVSNGANTNFGFLVSYDIELIRCQSDCSPVSNGANYYCPCDTNQTPFNPPPYDQCPYGCYSNSRYCTCSYPPTNVDSNSSTSPPPDCGQSTYSDLTGSITSYNYPDYYQNSQTCNYYIEAPSLSTITFTFNGLGLQRTARGLCSYEWIEFTCESNSLSQPITYCGFGYRPPLSFKPCSSVRLSYVNRGSAASIGFSVSYEIQPIRCQGDCSPVSNGASYSCPCDANQNPFIPPPYDQCPYYCLSSSPCTCSYYFLTDAYSSTPPSSTTDSPLACVKDTNYGLSGNITFMNYPNNYQNYQTCNYHILASSLSTINFTFNGLFLEQSTTCGYDWIEITCKSNSISQPIRYCGFGYRPQLSFKPCSYVRVTFVSDGSVTNIGFSVSYNIEPIRCQGDCSPVSNGASYYCPCDTNQTLFIPPPYDQCPYGCFSSSPYCACNYPPTNVDSNSSTSPPTIKTTPHFIPTNSPDCRQSTYRNLTGRITSPNYPDFIYSQNNLNCNYYIDAPSLSTINFIINHLDLEPSSTCYHNWIEFTCESYSISQPIRYCGSDYGYRLELSFKPCSRVRMWFYSYIIYANRFSVSYKIEPIRCQGDCAPVSDGASYYCPCDANQTPFVPQPYDQCPHGCYSSLNPTYCACSYPNFNGDSNSFTSPPFSTDSYLVIDDNSSGNVSPSATTRPSLVTPTTRPATVNVGNSSGYVSQFATIRPSLVSPSSRPATVNVGNSSGIVFQSTTTRPSNLTTRTTPRTVTPNEGNHSSSSPHVPRQ